MADVQTALRKRLLNAPAVSAIVGAKIALSTAAQGWSLPYITIRMISEVWDEHLKGGNGQAESRLRIEIAGATYAQVVALSKAAAEAAVGVYTIDGIRIVSRQDLIADRPTQTSDDNTIEGRIIDLLVRHNLA